MMPQLKTTRRFCQGKTPPHRLSRGPVLRPQNFGAWVRRGNLRIRRGTRLHGRRAGNLVCAKIKLLGGAQRAVDRNGIDRLIAIGPVVIDLEALEACTGTAGGGVDREHDVGDCVCVLFARVEWCGYVIGIIMASGEGDECQAP